MATEKRLIDANYLMKAIRERTTGSGDNFDIIMTHLYGIVEAVPTVDAVEVVRCKDCKYCERDHTLDGGGDEYYYCWHVVMEHGQARSNEFCCFGERKDND